MVYVCQIVAEAVLVLAVTFSHHFFCIDPRKQLLHLSLYVCHQFVCRCLVLAIFCVLKMLWR